VPFDPASKYMATFHPEPGGGHTRAYVKGAVDVLLERCDSVVTGDGVQSLDDQRRTEILAAASAMSHAGLRVLGAATTVLASRRARRCSQG
jgi:Ca2+-transporting ATPase